jgi:hypothetical protein
MLFISGFSFLSDFFWRKKFWIKCFETVLL